MRKPRKPQRLEPLPDIADDSLERIASEIAQCQKCDLCKTRNKTVPGAGPANVRLVFIGEAPGGVPNNLMPYICQVAVGQRDRLSVFGGDWPTVDGTGVRDYIHVVDLARAHADALDFLVREGRSANINLGTGRGTSVLELVRAFERASNRQVPYEIVARRPGDVAEVYADPSLAHALLGWRAEFDIDAMCRDAWRWQSLNPRGYEDGEAQG